MSTISVRAILAANAIGAYYSKAFGLCAQHKRSFSFFVNASSDSMRSRRYYNDPDALAGCWEALDLGA